MCLIWCFLLYIFKRKSQDDICVCLLCTDTRPCPIVPLFCTSLSCPDLTGHPPTLRFVLEVKATDADKGINGQVKYSIVQQPNQKGTKFTVDEDTGKIYTNKVR